MFLYLKKNIKILQNNLTGNFALYKNIRYVILVFLAYIYLFTCFRISDEAGILATRNAGQPVSDILHSLLPKLDTSFYHNDLVMGMRYLRNYLLLFFPSRIIFGIVMLGTLALVRAVFINLTNIGIPNGSNPIVSGNTFGGDLFFSGHVAFPYMLALVFWDIKIIRFFFLFSSVLLGVESIVGRYHYSIDVFATPFIVYGVYKIGVKLFNCLNIVIK